LQNEDGEEDEKGEGVEDGSIRIIRSERKKTIQ